MFTIWMLTRLCNNQQPNMCNKCWINYIGLWNSRGLKYGWLVSILKHQILLDWALCVLKICLLDKALKKGVSVIHFSRIGPTHHPHYLHQSDLDIGACFLKFSPSWSWRTSWYASWSWRISWYALTWDNLNEQAICWYNSCRTSLRCVTHKQLPQGKHTQELHVHTFVVW